jgi:hypothetical protein
LLSRIAASERRLLNAEDRRVDTVEFIAGGEPTELIRAVSGGFVLKSEWCAAWVKHGIRHDQR